MNIDTVLNQILEQMNQSNSFRNLNYTKDFINYNQNRNPHNKYADDSNAEIIDCEYIILNENNTEQEK